MMKMPVNLHSGAFLETYGNYKFKVLNRKLHFFHKISIYSEQECLRNFKRSKSMYINVGEDPEIRFLEDIEQLQFSQTILFRIYDTSGKLREILEIRVFT